PRACPHIAAKIPTATFLWVGQLSHRAHVIRAMVRLIDRTSLKRWVAGVVRDQSRHCGVMPSGLKPPIGRVRRGALARQAAEITLAQKCCLASTSRATLFGMCSDCGVIATIGWWLEPPSSWSVQTIILEF